MSADLNLTWREHEVLRDLIGYGGNEETFSSEYRSWVAGLRLRWACWYSANYGIEKAQRALNHIDRILEYVAENDSVLRSTFDFDTLDWTVTLDDYDGEYEIKGSASQCVLQLAGELKGV